jgi:predicted ATPase with chaperone activity
MKRGQSPGWVAMTQLNLSALADYCIFRLARTIAELTESKKFQSAHLADALHASQPAEVDAQHCVLSWRGLRSHLDGAKG